MIRRTPILEVEAEAFGSTCTLKLDLFQPTGSFKVRGAASLMTSIEVPPAGVVAASGGNFGQAIAWAAGRLGHPAHIFVPATSPEEKIAPIRRWGAEVHVVDGYYAHALAAAHDHVEVSGAAWAHAYDQREVVAGQGTVAKELLDEVPDVDTVLTACGGGGLLAGIAGWLQERVRVIAVETDGTSAFHSARTAGHPVDVEVGGIAASALGAPRVGDLSWAARRWVDDAIIVSDAEVVAAQHTLWEASRLVAEPGGATALAALTSGRYIPGAGERLVVLVCGANTAPGSVGVGPGG